MKRTRTTLILILLSACIAGPGYAPAQTPPPGAKQSEDLAHSAEFIRKKLDELLATMSDVATLLEKTDPEAARILRQTVVYAQQEDVVTKIDEVKKLLRQGLDQAAETSQAEVIGDLTHMLRLLEGAQSDLTETDERLAELREVRKRIADLLRRQEAEAARTRAVTAKEKIDKDSQALLETLQKLIQQQKELKEKTGKLPDPTAAVKKLSELHAAVERLRKTQKLLNDAAVKAAMARLPVLAEGQRKLLEQTKEVAEQLAAAGKDASLREALQAAGGDTKAVDKAASHTKAAGEPMQQAAGAMEASNQSKAAAPSREALQELTAAEKALAEAIRTLAAKTPAAELADSQSKLAEETKAIQDAAEAIAATAGVDATKLPAPNLPHASENMAKATGALEHQSRDPAQAEQTEALKALENELARAEELRRRAMENAQAKLDAAEQNAIAEQIDKAAESMKNGRDGKAMPGQPSAAQAGKSASQAGEALSQSDAAGANQRQNETSENLREAMKSLDDEIEKLQRRSKAEKLASISERLGKVLEQQKACTKQTRALHDARAKADSPIGRAEEQTLTELAGVEGELSVEIQSIRDLLRKEGTTVVFPAVLGDVKRDLLDVKSWLAEFDAGPLTQATQEEIEHTLEELLESVHEELSKGPGKGSGGGGGQPGGGQGKQPLIPPIAELRMLRMKQLRVNRNTKQLAEMVSAGTLPDNKQAAEYKKLAGRQGQVLSLVRSIREKLQKDDRNINLTPPTEEQP